MELKYTVQNYAWGKKGTNSEVACLIRNAFSDYAIEDDKPYAELWLGTHPNGPSQLKTNNKPLQDLICEYPEYLGENCTKQFGTNLPFLFKVLSINEALSIQVHPSKVIY